MSRTRALSCPACGGLLGLRDGDVQGSCAHCGLNVRRSDGVAGFLKPSSIDGTAALRSVRHFLTDRNARRGALGRARVGKPRLFLVPFWHVSAQVSGYSFGLEPVWIEEEIPVAPEGESGGDSMSVFGRTRTIRIRKGANSAAREIRLFSSVNISAADLESLGIPSLGEDAQFAVTGLEIQRTILPQGLEILDDKPAGEGLAVDPSVPLSQAVARADKHFGRLAAGSARGLEQRWQWFVISCRRVCLVYYPIWVVDFQCDGQAYRAVLDGVSGKVIRGLFPGRRRDVNVIAAFAAVVWAAFTPVIFSALVESGSSSTASNGIQVCQPGILVATGLAALGTWKLLGLLDSMSRKGTDVVV